MVLLLQIAIYPFSHGDLHLLFLSSLSRLHAPLTAFPPRVKALRAKCVAPKGPKPHYYHRFPIIFLSIH